MGMADLCSLPVDKVEQGIVMRSRVLGQRKTSMYRVSKSKKAERNRVLSWVE